MIEHLYSSLFHTKDILKIARNTKNTQKRSAFEVSWLGRLWMDRLVLAEVLRFWKWSWIFFCQAPWGLLQATTRVYTQKPTIRRLPEAASCDTQISQSDKWSTPWLGFTWATVCCGRLWSRCNLDTKHWINIYSFPLQCLPVWGWQTLLVIHLELEGEGDLTEPMQKTFKLLGIIYIHICDRTDKVFKLFFSWSFG